MTPETFLEKFDQFAEAPNAVAKMRELVLVLAVQGKLVPQDPDDEPAVALLTRAVKARRHLVAAKIVRAEAPDVTFLVGSRVPLPVGWVAAPLRVYAGVIMGQSPPSSSYNQDGRGLPFYQGKSQFGQLYPQANHWCTEPTKVGEPGDVVISVRAPVGPTNMLREKSCLGRGLTALRGLGGDQMYLLYALRAFEKQIAALGVGSTFVAISKSDLDNFFLPIPPLTEQKRIVAKVDELMALCDRLEGQQRERDTRNAALARASLARFAEAPTPANLDFLFHDSYTIDPADLRKTILSLAVQGRLVTQDPSDERPQETLARLGLQSTAASTRGAEANEDSIPSSWTRVRFEDVAVVAGGVTLGRKLGGRRTITLPYLRVANVKRGELDLGVIKEVTIAEDEIERYRLRNDDLLMTEGGDWDKVGRAAIWRDEIPLCLHQNHIFRARMRSDELSPLWFERYFNSPDGRSYFESASKQTTNLASINMRQVRGCPVPLPPLAEQRRIVAKVDQLMALVEQLEAQITAARTTATKLMNAMVAALTVED